MQASELSRLYSHVELHIRNDPEFTKLFGARVKATTGSNYSACRGHSFTRYVTICIKEEAGIDLLESILARFPADCMILRYPRSRHVGDVRVYQLDYSAPFSEGALLKVQLLREDGVTGKDIVLSRVKGFRYTDLKPAIEKAADLVDKASPRRMHNTIALAIALTVAAHKDFAKGLCLHLEQHRRTALALDVAMERIELRVLRGELCRRTLAIWKPGQPQQGVHCSFSFTGKVPNTGRLACHLCYRTKET